MTIELVSSWNELSSLEAHWNELAGDMPFRSWDWLAMWWKHYGTGATDSRNEERPQTAEKQLYVLAVFGQDGRGNTQDGKPLIGIAPWYLDRTVIHGNVLRWLGSGEVCTDHLSLICRSEHRQQVAAAVAEELTANCDDWDRIDLGAVDADDAAVAALVDAFEERDCLVSRHAANAFWVLEMPQTWDDYLASISKSHRKQLRQLERRVLESQRVRWHQVASAGELPAVWEILVDLHQRRRKSLGEPGCFASRQFHDFHREVTQRLLARGQLRMSWLALDGSPAAAEYHVADSSATYAYQGGVDPERLAEEPGRLSAILCLRAAIAEGHSRVDFLRGDEPYKAHWRAAPQPTFDCRIIPNRRLARLRGRVLNVTGAITDWVRQTIEQKSP
ncbi:MAG TPA: GNAT family N-acetyltransferase [Lacipirellulaceae bacterium]|nr:GNAT family N-acetyltransferase [Lacipirellulaceae bacterium]